MAFTARVEYVRSGSSLSSPYNLSVTKPVGTVNGDILFCFICVGSSSVIDLVPPGWTLLAYFGSTLRWSVYWKVAEDEGASWVWSVSNSTKHLVICSCYTGGDFNPDDPIDVVSNTTYVEGDNQVVAASMDVAFANSPLVFWAGVGSSSTKTFIKPTVPTGDWIEDHDAGSGSPDMWAEICSDIWDGSGETGAIAATVSVVMTNKHAFAVALIPVGEGGNGAPSRIEKSSVSQLIAAGII